MCQDYDMKIAGDKPSQQKEVEKTDVSGFEEYPREVANGNIERAKKLGAALAEAFVAAGNNDCFDGSCPGDSDELDRQKLLLLCFTVLSTLETKCPAVCTVKIAKAAFFDALRAIDADLPDRSTDTGAFSFYYLSYRRGTEVDRRIGQTFAMLCAHDGDPIYQELGEAIYCWFYSVVNKKIKQAAFAVS